MPDVGLGTVLGVGGNVLGGLIGADAAGDAAGVQSDAARYAADASLQGSRESNALIREMWQLGRQDLAPWLSTGQNSLRMLGFLSGVGNIGDYIDREGLKNRFTTRQDITAANFNAANYLAGNPDVAADPYWREHALEHWQKFGQSENRKMATGFDQRGYNQAIQQQMERMRASGGFGSLTRAPTMEQIQMDPGYQFRQQQGELGMNRALASRGLYDSGAALKALTRYNQDFATGEYSNAYNRFQQNTSNIYNRLAGLSGTGQVAAQQVGASGNAAGNNMAGITMGGVNAATNALMGGANARASGYIGGANALSQGFAGAGNSYFQNQLLGHLMGGGNMGGYPLIQGSVPGQFNLDTYG